MFLTKAHEQDVIRLLSSIKTDTETDGWQTSFLVGSTIGSIISLRGTTSFEDSLKPVFDATRTLIDEINEIYIIPVDETLRHAEYALRERWSHFFNGSTRFRRNALADEIYSLSKREIEGFVDQFTELLKTTGITYLNHGNTEVEERPTVEQSRTPSRKDETYQRG